MKFKSGDVVRLKGRRRTKGLVSDALAKPEGNIYLVKWHRSLGPTKDASTTWEGEDKLEVVR